MKMLVVASFAAMLGLSLGAAQAQTAGSAQKSTAEKKAPAKSSQKKSSSSAKAASGKSSTKTSKGVSAQTARRVEANTPVEPPAIMQPLTVAEMAIAKQIHTGKIDCELGADVTVRPDERNPGFFVVSTGKQIYHMHPVESRTGAIRLEDNRAGALWLQLGNKSMLMNQKLGQRVADDCQAPVQREFAAQLKAQPQVDLLGGGK
ncbi:MAG: hypothetical protein LCH89_20820 [Proteobacteria bacterium]|jgi:hypothetical protein|nr:hypothetical protein [Pseudomonadota bacterium]